MLEVELICFQQAEVPYRPCLWIVETHVQHRLERLCYRCEPRNWVVCGTTVTIARSRFRMERSQPRQGEASPACLLAFGQGFEPMKRFGCFLPHIPLPLIKASCVDR